MSEKQDVIRGAFDRHQAVLTSSLASVLPDALTAAALIDTAAKSGKRLFVCGNGGSAADSQHFAAEWTCRYSKERPPLPAVALTVDTSALTAIGNDYSFEEVFARQVKALATSGDVLVVLTTSGGSSNILAALRQARSQGVVCIALTGEKGVHLKDQTDVAIVVPSTETARIQEIHEIIYHAWCEYVDFELG
jgi:D-sedoheptulose 7-phosphate isomerase